jgi:nucleotide-binding universal stress UspA family protein
MSVAEILVPVDFSPASEEAARLGFELARRDGARLDLVHVNELPEMAVLGSEQVVPPPRLWEQLQARYDDRVERKFAALRAELDPRGDSGVRIRAFRRHGYIVDSILGQAADMRADLIVIGSHGAGGAIRFLFGSVAAKVSRTAPCPVLVARPRSDDEGPSQGLFRRVLVAIDYSPFAAPAAEAAVRVAEPGGAIGFVHVWQEPGHFTADREIAGTQPEFAAAVEQTRADEATRLATFVASLELPLVDHVSFLEIGSPAQCILSRAEAFKADLLVLGAHGRRGITEKILGTIADRVLRHAETPVLLIPQAALR